jgi:plasmid maintenance system antidote protein VapI
VTSTGINANRGLVELFNVKNVTINGDDPNAAGGRNLSIVVPTASASATSAIRIGSSSVTNFAENITIRNCIIRGGRPSATSSIANFGISISNANTFVSPANANGINARGILLENNEIYRAQFGIYSFGGTAAGNEHAVLTFQDNFIGATADADAVGQAGISLIGSSSAGGASVIKHNVIIAGSSISGGLANDVVGIDVQNFNPNLDIRENEIRDIINNNTSTGFNVAGIRVAGVGNTDIEIWNNIQGTISSPRPES